MNPENSSTPIRRRRDAARPVVLAIAGLAVAGASGLGYWLGVRASKTSPVAVGSIAAAGRTSAGGGASPAWRRQPEYVGSQACRECHADQFETYSETAHSRALSDVDPDHEPPDAVFDHVRSGRRYRVTREEGRLFHEESLPLDDGSEFKLTKLPLEYRVGSGHFGRTYLCNADAYLVESPLTWYEPAREWGMSPGYDSPVHRSFTRVIPENCLLCHAGLVETNTASDYRLRLAENSIGCERCHGPGRRHVEEQTRGEQTRGQPAPPAADRKIVNPRRLSRKLSEAICQQCHLQGDIQVAGRGVRLADYRPGEPLEIYRTQFRMRGLEGGMTVVGHVEQLGESACYRQSGTLTCVTCHDPHAPVAPAERPGHYRKICASCHADDGCKLPLPERHERAENDCTHCHMPHAATEVPHVAFTHHHIGIHPLAKASADAEAVDPVVPLSDLSGLSESDRTRALVLARVILFLRMSPAVRQSREGQAFERETDDRLRRLPAVAVDAPVEVGRAEFNFTRGDLRGAVQAAERALKFDDIETDEAARASVVLGFVAFQQNRLAEARRHYAKLVGLRRDARDWFYLAICESNAGNVKEAIGTLEKSLEIDPSNAGTYEALAAMHHARHEFDAEQRRRGELEKLERWRSALDDGR